MCDELIIKLEVISALARPVPLRNPVHLSNLQLFIYLLPQMAFGKKSDDTAVDLQRPSLLEVSACLVGGEKQHNIGEVTWAGRINLGNTCCQKWSSQR